MSPSSISGAEYAIDPTAAPSMSPGEKSELIPKSETYVDIQYAPQQFPLSYDCKGEAAEVLATLVRCCLSVIWPGRKRKIFLAKQCALINCCYTQDGVGLVG
jgi:hypothetical protein